MTDPHSPNVPDVEPEFLDEKTEKAILKKRADPAKKPPAAETGEPTGHRDGECVPNVPDVKPEAVSEAAAARAEANAAALAADEPEAEGFALTRWLRWGYFVASLALVALFGVFVFSQAISALAQAATLPDWQRYLLLTPLALCSALLLLVAGSLAWSWFRLRAIRQIDMSALAELKNRADTRRDGVERYQAARSALENYVRDYPLAGRNAERLRRAGFKDEAVAGLAQAREDLLAGEGDSHGWLVEYQGQFQKRLDEAAARRVNSWALRAAGCVIASPLPLLDAILILAISLRMIRDLCVVYNVRTGGASSFLLFTRAIRNAFIAGLADEAGGAAGEMLGEEMTGMLGEGALGTLGASFVRVAAPKLGEGALNGLFMRRLGKATVRMLQPLRG